MTHDVFLSYSHNDKAVADAACSVFERNRVRVWMAPRDVLPGVGWAGSIINAINDAQVMVLIFSNYANTSPQIEREVERAISKRIPVLPFRVEDVQPSAALEYFISAPHWLDAITPPLEQHLDALTDAVKRLLGSEYALRPREEGKTDFERRAGAAATILEQAATQASGEAKHRDEEAEERLQRFKEPRKPDASIVIFGVGGGGCNIVGKLQKWGLCGVELIATNTSKSIVSSTVPRIIILGNGAIEGRGTGGHPENGRKAARESASEIRRHLQNTLLCIVIAGIGGGTGTGAAPVIAQSARDSGALTIGIAVTPFSFERSRISVARTGIADFGRH